MTASLKTRNRGNNQPSAISDFWKKQSGNILPPLVAIALFLLVWQLFSWTPGATLPLSLIHI